MPGKAVRKLFAGESVLRKLHSFIKRDHLVRNAGTLMVNTLLTSGFGLIFWITASNRQTPAELGSASALIALFPLAATIGGLGLDAAVFRHFAMSSNRRKLVNRAVVTSATFASIVGLGLGVSSQTEMTAWQTLLVVIATAALGSNAVTTAAIMASRRTGLILIEGTFSSVVKIVALITLPGDMFGLLTAVVVGIITSSLTSAAVVYGVLRPAKLKSVTLEPISGYAASNWVSASFSLLPFSILPALVLWRSGPEAAAYVAVAALISPLLRLIPSMVTRSFFAEVAAAPEKLKVLLRRTYLISLGLTTAAATTLALLAPYVLALFGSSYRSGSTALVRYLALATVIAVANYLADAVLNLLHDHRAFMFTNITGMTSLMVILVMASPLGVAGIGGAWIAGELLYATIAWTTIFARHRRQLRRNP